MAAERLLVDGSALLGDAARGLDDLGPAAVVERDPEVEPRLARGRALELAHLLLQPVGRAVAPADEPRAHALLRQVGQLAVDRLAEDLHQRLDLVGRARPVLGGERVHRERFDAEIDCSLDDGTQRSRAGAMALGDAHAVRARPAAVAVHDDRDRLRDLRQPVLGRRLGIARDGGH